MDARRQGQLEEFGFLRTHLEGGLAGERLWWKRTGTSMDIVRQHDGATKHQDLGEGHPGLPADEPAANRRWAVALAHDALTDWHAA